MFRTNSAHSIPLERQPTDDRRTTDGRPTRCTKPVLSMDDLSTSSSDRFASVINSGVELMLPILLYGK
eukprot:scaffold22568_cov125-Cylindrotheca_fusiformis.AAC.11